MVRASQCTDDILGAVSMVHVEVDDGNFFDAITMGRQSVEGRHCN